MNYLKAYERLIERARLRTLEGYGENHHILPRCMGGSDEKENIARLTGREHFVAHVLLVKIYPKEHKLIYAVNSMCRFNKKQERSKNRMYGWLRERHAEVVSERNRQNVGILNSQYGTCWVYFGNISKKIKKEHLEQYLLEGWSKGRRKKFLTCLNCEVVFSPVKYEKCCSDFCRNKKITEINKKNTGILARNWNGYWHTPYGVFETIIEASEHLKLSIPTLQYRFKSKNFGDYNKCLNIV